VVATPGFHLARRHDRDTGKQAYRPAARTLDEPPLAPVRVRAHVGHQRDCVGVDIRRQFQRLLDRVALADHEVAALAPQRLPEIRQ
jgi:hypothetical protein